ncbi:protein SIEVE ELEMENT OCCLUSION B-like protein [Cinnamomum micranthum f. kanehirae]|uniref:Protein SIEVE ELEMENT OCCLUSION B-like protein n=1 Tax=Cinnamomum micranthum f. kanehirae TaxID=337451 RepID=A0A443N7C3_9MAGN|nr:protein SIEVE ELEMENT OCCLUSION B-like protein [Cinnamomum micranthum f. kanehirae]
MDPSMKNILNGRRTLFSQQPMMVVQTQSTSDDKKVIQQILAAHSPDANFNVNEQVLLNMAQDILNKANPKFPPLDQKIDPKVLEEGIINELVFTIHKIGCELSCNCSGGGEMKSITVAVFDALVKYSWEDKLVIALLAFAVNYGDSCLPRQVDATNPLVKYLVQFKSLPHISGLINYLMKVVIDVTKSIIKLIELHSRYSHYVSLDKPPLSLAKFSEDVYWAIKGIVACSSQSGLMNVGNQHWGENTDACVVDIIQILENRHRDLTKIWDQCNKEIEKKEEENAYDSFVEFMERNHTDNMEVLIELIHTKDNTPLFHRDTNTKVNLNVLQGKTVILFFSYFDVSDEEIKEIEQQAWKTDKRPYEIVWLPILYRQDLSDEIKKVIERKARLMPWYSLHYSLTLKPYVIKYIKNKWHFEKKPLLVALNEQGNINSFNVYNMIKIWESKAYPFDRDTEENLWSNFKWRLGFFIDGEHVQEGKLIYLYGGDDLVWIEKFISTVKKVVKGDMIKLIYVGKKHREIIKKRNLSECWDDQKIRRFWARMESIFNYKAKSESIADDKTFNDVLTLLGSEGSRNGWAITGDGSDDMFASNGETITQLLVHLDQLAKVPITIPDFFNELRKFKPTTLVTHCCHIYVTSTSGINEENMICAVCRCPMEKQVRFPSGKGVLCSSTAASIAESGKLITWGSTDDLGQSYLTSGKHEETPEPFPLPTEASIVKVAAGWAHCVPATVFITLHEHLMNVDAALEWDGVDYGRIIFIYIGSSSPQLKLRRSSAQHVGVLSFETFSSKYHLMARPKNGPRPKNFRFPTLHLRLKSKNEIRALLSLSLHFPFPFAGSLSSLSVLPGFARSRVSGEMILSSGFSPAIDLALALLSLSIPPFSIRWLSLFSLHSARHDPHPRTIDRLRRDAPLLRLLSSDFSLPPFLHLLSLSISPSPKTHFLLRSSIRKGPNIASEV